MAHAEQGRFEPTDTQKASESDSRDRHSLAHLRSVDDCCTSTRMSLDMLDALAAIGFSTIAATPDLSERLMPEFDAQVCEAYHQIATMPVQKAWR